MKNIIQRNKKDALLEFLFGKDEDNKLLSEGSNPQGEEIIKTLQNQVDSLQQRGIHLENQTNDLKNTLSVTLEILDATKIIQQNDWKKVLIRAKMIAKLYPIRTAIKYAFRGV